MLSESGTPTRVVDQCKATRVVDQCAKVSLGALYHVLGFSGIAENSLSPSQGKWVGSFRCASAIPAQTLLCSRSYPTFLVSSETSRGDRNKKYRVRHRRAAVASFLPSCSSDASTVEYCDLWWFRLALRWRMPPVIARGNRSGFFSQRMLINHILEETSSNLPLKFLSSMNMLDVAYERALLILSRNVHASILGLMSRSWSLWIVYCHTWCHASRQAPARTIQLLGRMHASLRKLKNNRIKKLECAFKKSQGVLNNVAFFLGQGRRIQSFLIRCALIKRANTRRHIETAVVISQKAIRARMKTSQDSAQLTKLHAKHSMAIIIQSAFRGAASRVHSTRHKYRNQHVLVHARYQNATTSVSYNFEQQGAVQKIQNWLKLQPFWVACFQQKNRSQSVCKLQVFLRRRRFKKQVYDRIRRRRRLQIELWTRRRVAAALIQCFGRANIARFKIKKLRESAKKETTLTSRKATIDSDSDALRSTLYQLTQVNLKTRKKFTSSIVRMQSMYRGSVSRANLASQQVRRARNAASQFIS